MSSGRRADGLSVLVSVGGEDGQNAVTEAGRPPAGLLDGASCERDGLVDLAEGRRCFGQLLPQGADAGSQCAGLAPDCVQPVEVLG
jgi:hypothetical protein